MGRNGIRVALLVIIVLLGALLFQRHKTDQERAARQRAELQAGVDASRVLSAKFQQTGALRAARLTGSIMSRGNCVSGYMFNNEQRSVAPYSVNYMVDLSGIDRSRLRWNGKDRVMFVELPGITVEAANIDMGRARSEQTGVFVSRGCGLAMQRQVAARLGAAAAVRASRPDYLTKAADSARFTVRNLLRATLAAADMDDIDVRVRLANDPRPKDREEWDRSRSIDEVLAETGQP